MQFGKHLAELFTYDRWANREVLAALQGVPSPPRKAGRLAAHIVAAQMLWMDRIRGTGQRAPVWPEWTASECATHMETSAREWEEFLSGISDSSLDRRIVYTNTKGETWNNTVRDIAVHVAMHGTYHRAQVATELRAAGITPPYTDYIEAVRTGKLAAGA